ncbi:MAG: hypothetical protein VW124_21845 [Paracoccaceae bacterium]
MKIRLNRKKQPGKIRPNSSELLLRTMVILTSSILSLFVAEILYRIYEDEPFTLVNYIHKRTDLVQAGWSNDRRGMSTYDPLLGWVLTPYLHIDEFQPGADASKTTFVTTGQYGIRMNSPKIVPIPKNSILAVGDSFTAGSEVSDSQSWPAYLEDILQEPVINGGTGAWGVDQIVLRAEQLIEKISPKTIIISVMVDDSMRNQYRVLMGGSKPYFTIKSGKLVHHNFPVKKFSPSFRDLNPIHLIFGYSLLIDRVMLRLHPYAWHHIGAPISRIKSDHAAVSCKLIERLKFETDQKGIRLLFLMQYGMEHINIWQEQPRHVQRIISCVKEFRIENIDLWNDYQSMKNLSGVKFLKDFSAPQGHFSAEGNLHVATVLAKKFWPEK